MTDLTTLIQHPELLNKETLYELRSVVALHPYYQPARFLLLRNLYLLHDSSFDDELRRAALFVTDRRVLFQLIEGAHYQVRSEKDERKKAAQPVAPSTSSNPSAQESTPPTEPSRTATLIDDFLSSLPAEDEQPGEKRKPTPADATIDYVAYLLETESSLPADDEPQMKGQSLIDTFINEDKGRMTLQEETEYEPEDQDAENGENGAGEDFFTETLAQIYIKQGRYSKALEIIRRLNLIYPKKNRYFADQIRFLEKLILNNNK